MSQDSERLLNVGLGMEKSYAIGNPISKPYIEAIFGINNRGRVLGLTVWIAISPSVLLF